VYEVHPWGSKFAPRGEIKNRPLEVTGSIQLKKSGAFTEMPEMFIKMKPRYPDLCPFLK
jgi:hypothetical protein